METSVQVEPKKTNTGLIIIGIIVAVVVCCCLTAVIVFAVVTIMGPLVGDVYSTINSSLSTPIP